jgi:Protein of unknown function (DUF1003)
VAFAGWVIVNAGIISQPFDPFPYSLLSSITSLDAVLIAGFVLMKQNRMGIIADRRDHLDLQVNLLTERHATQIIQMLDRLSIHLTSSSTMTIMLENLGFRELVLPPEGRRRRRATAAPRRRRGARTDHRTVGKRWRRGAVADRPDMKFTAFSRAGRRSPARGTASGTGAWYRA